MNPLRAFMVAVDYLDILSITLPYNLHHFGEVHIITSPDNHERVSSFVWDDMLKRPEVQTPKHMSVLATDLFYADGAEFNKWRALEWGLDLVGRDGWLCLMDADVLWPTGVTSTLGFDGNLVIEGGDSTTVLKQGELLTPYRRMFPDLSKLVEDAPQLAGRLPQGLPPEHLWSKFSLHRNSTIEFPGYTQIFHGSDPHLGEPPWHDVNWQHAGGADSFFQRKWPITNKVRPKWEVLHLGEAGMNWFGRATPYLDGTEPPQGAERRAKVKGIWPVRGQLRRAGDDPYSREKLPKKP